MTRLSFIIPLYNDENNINNIVMNIQRQNVDDYEIIFIDDASEDNTEEVIKKLEGIVKYKYLKNETNQGPAFSRNLGLSVAEGTYVRFVDADDILPEGSTRNLIELAEQYNSKVVRGSYKCTDENNVVIFEKKVEKVQKVSSKSSSDLILKALDGHWCFLFNRQFMIENKLAYANEMTTAEDSFMLQQLVKLNQPIIYSPLICYQYIRPKFGGRLTDRKSLTAVTDFTKLLSNFYDITLRVNRQDLFFTRFSNAFDYIYKKRVFSRIDELSVDEKEEVLVALRKLLIKVNFLNRREEDLKYLKSKLGRYYKYLIDLCENYDEVIKYNRNNYIELECIKEIDVSGVFECKNSVPLYAWTGNINFGDILIFDWLESEGINYHLSTLTQCKLITVGSILHNFLMCKKNVGSNKKMYVWGSGFISDNPEELTRLIGPFVWKFNRNIEFCALRGRLTQEMVQTILNRKLTIALGDPGLLVKRLYTKEVQKKYDVGIILHWKESVEMIRKRISLRKYSYTFINPAADPELVVRKIKECRCIISSSLHGLIMADAFNIPSRHMIVSDKVEGGTFKFRDYYSAYEDYKYENFNIYKMTVTDAVIERIVAKHRDRSTEVDNIIESLLETFPVYAKNYKNPIKRLLFKTFKL